MLFPVRGLSSSFVWGMHVFASHARVACAGQLLSAVTIEVFKYGCLVGLIGGIDLLLGGLGALSARHTHPNSCKFSILRVLIGMRCDDLSQWYYYSMVPVGKRS